MEVIWFVVSNLDFSEAVDLEGFNHGPNASIQVEVRSNVVGIFDAKYFVGAVLSLDGAGDADDQYSERSFEKG